MRPSGNHVSRSVRTLKHAAVGHVSTFWLTRTSTDRSSRLSRSLWNRGTWNCTTAPGRPSGVSPVYRSSPASQSHRMVELALPVQADTARSSQYRSRAVTSTAA